MTDGILINPLIHSSKGSTWKNHKYIRKENGRYYYNSKERSPHYNQVQKSNKKPYKSPYTLREANLRRMKGQNPNRYPKAGAIMDIYDGTIDGTKFYYRIDRTKRLKDVGTLTRKTNPKKREKGNAKSYERAYKLAYEKVKNQKVNTRR